MKILMVDSLVGNDYTISLCKGLRRSGLDLELITTECREFDSPLDFPVRLWSPPKDQRQNKISKTLAYFKYLIRLYRHIRRSRPDAVHFQFFRRGRIESFYFALLRFSGTRLVYTAHNILPHENNRLDYYFKGLVYKSAHCLIVHSQFIKDKLLRHFKLNPDKVRVIPHGNFDIYQPDHNLSESTARQALGLTGKDDLLLFFGYIREYKGLDTLLEAFALASEQNARLKLWIAGAPQTPKLQEAYETQIATIPTKDRIVFQAEFIPTEAVATYFTAADAVVLPYKHIDHSGIVHMAYTFGKPLIATPVGDFGETIEHGRSGYVLGNNDARSLANVILEAFSDKERLAAMGNYARELSETKYSWNDIARKTISAYGGTEAPLQGQVRRPEVEAILRKPTAVDS